MPKTPEAVKEIAEIEQKIEKASKGSEIQQECEKWLKENIPAIMPTYTFFLIKPLWDHSSGARFRINYYETKDREHSVMQEHVMVGSYHVEVKKKGNVFSLLNHTAK